MAKGDPLDGGFSGLEDWKWGERGRKEGDQRGTLISEREDEKGRRTKCKGFKWMSGPTWPADVAFTVPFLVPFGSVTVWKCI